ncbi:MAG: DNA-protecting protein DprA [Actinobacteria bacterium]|nr:DNA-protecting protein DprA [Actinomycetota bacterium]
MTATDGRWRSVAAPGTDPDLLAAVVRRLRDVGPATLAREARDHAASAGGDPPATVLRRVVPPVLPTGERDDEVAGTWAGLGVRVALVGDPGFPARLAVGWPGTGGPPLLAVRGSLAPHDGPAVAIVGARRATSYGTGVAAWLAESAAAAGAVVVSGGAVGIDAAAHGAAADHGTVVVLGCGHDVAYPRPHTVAGGLFERVLAGGGALVSEHLPGAAPVAGHVRARNRIVAGLADVVVVVEGGPRSGALVTAGYAADAGVPVLAVPGDVRRPGSAAPHLLLREGAEPCTSPDDLLAALSLAAPVGPDGAAPAVSTTLPPAVHRVLAGAWPRPLRLDALAEQAEVPAARLLALVTRARVAGEVAEGADGIRLTRAPR